MDKANNQQPVFTEGVTTFAKTTFRGQEQVFGIKQEDRRKHFYVIGKTGMGKTTMLQNMIINDIHAGRGVGIVDPHGDIAEDILDFIPPSRVNDVIYFNPADTDFPIGFNVFEKVKDEHKYLIASGLVGVFKKLYAESWGPRLEYILRNTILALLDYPQATMLGILKLLADKKYRNDVIKKIEDPVIKSFWLDEFANYNERFASEAVSPIQNKVGQFLSSTIIRNIVGQVKSSFDIREIMDNGKILVLSLSKGRIGEDNTALLGSMMITKIQLAAMSRANIPEEERKDFYLYVDEFQNFATESFATILSEARKYRLNLTIAHQYIEQMSEEVRDAVFGNVGTIAAFRVGATDAEYLEKEFEPVFMQNDLVNLPAYNMYLKMMIDGLTSQGFSAVSIPRIDQLRVGEKDKIIKVSRERYSRNRVDVEDRIKRWSAGTTDLGFDDQRGSRSAADRMTQKINRRQRRGSDNKGKQYGGSGNKTDRSSDRQMFNAICDTCNKVIEVPFKPDPKREVYCRECLPQAQREKDVRAKHTHSHAPGSKVTGKSRGRRPRASQKPQRGGGQDRPPVHEKKAMANKKNVSLREALAPVKQAMQKKGSRQPKDVARTRSIRPQPGQKAGTGGSLEEGQEISFDN